MARAVRHKGAGNCDATGFQPFASIIDTADHAPHTELHL